jgi:hypothetical protein
MKLTIIPDAATAIKKNSPEQQYITVSLFAERKNQCCGSMKFLYRSGSGSADPYF